MCFTRSARKAGGSRRCGLHSILRIRSFTTSRCGCATIFVLNYDPSEAFAAEEEHAEKEAEINRMEDLLGARQRAAIEDAKNRPPPETVLAYNEVFGSYPSGWPPWQEEE